MIPLVSGIECIDLLYFIADFFTDLECTPTSGIDFKLRTIELEGKKVRLQILDTAGQERFRSITSLHYKKAMGIILVYDITNRLSFQSVEEWMRNIEKHSGQPVSIILVGLSRFIFTDHDRACSIYTTYSPASSTTSDSSQ